MTTKYLDFEKPIAELEGKIEELKHLADNDDLKIVDDVTRLQSKANRLLRQAYGSLTSWQRVQVARHPDRPKFFNYLNALFTDFTPLAGDRSFGEDCAIIGGMARFEGQSVMVIGQQKGDDTASRLKHNFGMARPEGYRKAIRLMELADRFNMPVVTFVDTAGAYPGVDAEERGQAEAIARSIEKCFDIKVPLISIVIGEGGSGGAIALAAANQVLMLENSVYSVISPEGCASILWRSAEKAPEASEALKLTARDLLKLNIIDSIIQEPIGGAHRHQETAINMVKQNLEKALEELSHHDGVSLKEARREKFLKIGHNL